MIDRSVSSAEAYSPLRRTAVVLTGTGTAGAYHAGALRAFQEAGVKIDIVAAHGAGVIGAMFSAIDGGARLWDEGGFWRGPGVAGLYPWRSALRGAVVALSLSFLVLTLPMLALAAGLIVFPIDFLAKTVGLGGAGGLTTWYTGLVNRAFAPDALPTWLPRFVLLILGLAATAIVVTAYGQWRARRPRGALWWHAVPEPLSAESAIERCWTTLWDLVRGAAQVKQPDRADLGRRFTEMLGENLGQPGFRELLMVVHDVDARRDLVFALVHERTRRDFLRGNPASSSETRAGEVFDLGGVGREHMADVVAAALSVPLATPYHGLRFAPDSVWRGETHRAADRPSSLERVIDELALLGVEQVILVTSASSLTGAHALAPPRMEGRARLGEFLQSSEAAVVRDVVARARADGRRMFVVRPTHNPIGPFDFPGGFDDRSVRAKPLAELIHQGYEDAYFQFVEPVVGGSGERVGQV